MSINKKGGFSGIATIGIVAAIVAVVIMFGYSIFIDNKIDVKDTGVESSNSTQEIQNEATINDLVDEVSTSPAEGVEVAQEETITETKGSYEAYSAEKIAKAATGDVVLFFHASWCPSCRGLNNDIEKNLNKIPAQVTILKTDYDKETELKKKYGVTYQHTLVQVDENGNMIKKWSGGSRLENLLSQIQ